MSKTKILAAIGVAVFSVAEVVLLVTLVWLGMR